MVLDAPGRPLRAAELPVPRPRDGELLIRVHACGVCRTDLHVVDGEVRAGRLPVVPGHQIVGTVEGTGERVGVPWLGWTCGSCRYCRDGRENLCDRARFTGCDVDGGFAEYAVADARFCFPIPAGYPDLQAAPLLCAGLIGHRALRMTGDAERLGLYGFGAAAHIVCQVARHERRRVFAFTRAGDAASQPVRARAGRRVGGRLGRGAAGGARRGDRVRARRRAGPGGAAGAGEGRHGGLRRDPHERHPVVPVRGSCGASGRSARSPTSPAATPRSSSRWRRRCRCARASWATRWSAAGAALEDLRAGRFDGAAVVTIGDR